MSVRAGRRRGIPLFPAILPTSLLQSSQIDSPAIQGIGLQMCYQPTELLWAYCEVTDRGCPPASLPADRLSPRWASRRRRRVCSACATAWLTCLTKQTQAPAAAVGAAPAAAALLDAAAATQLQGRTVQHMAAKPLIMGKYCPGWMPRHTDTADGKLHVSRAPSSAALQAAGGCCPCWEWARSSCALSSAFSACFAASNG